MRAVVQRVKSASVEVESELVGHIGPGILLFVGVDVEDTPEDAVQLVEKVASLRIFNDEAGKFNLSLEDKGGAVLVVSQFTLHGDCRKGRRPSFTKAARPEQAIPLYESVADLFRARGIEVATGIFGAHMDVQLVNDGPVTILVDTRKVF